MSEAIEIKNLEYRWPGQKYNLLEIENLKVHSGERLFLKGASGSGKSTLLSLLGGVIVPLDFPRGFAAFAAVCKVPADQIRERISSTDLVVRLEKGTVEPGDFHREICDLLGMTASFDEFRELWSSIFLPESGR